MAKRAYEATIKEEKQDTACLRCIRLSVPLVRQSLHMLSATSKSLKRDVRMKKRRLECARATCPASFSHPQDEYGSEDDTQPKLSWTKKQAPEEQPAPKASRKAAKHQCQLCLRTSKDCFTSWFKCLHGAQSLVVPFTPWLEKQVASYKSVMPVNAPKKVALALYRICCSNVPSFP